MRVYLKLFFVFWLLHMIWHWGKFYHHFVMRAYTSWCKVNNGRSTIQVARNSNGTLVSDAHACIWQTLSIINASSMGSFQPSTFNWRKQDEFLWSVLMLLHHHMFLIITSFLTLVSLKEKVVLMYQNIIFL